MKDCVDMVKSVQKVVEGGRKMEVQSRRNSTVVVIIMKEVVHSGVCCDGLGSLSGTHHRVEDSDHLLAEKRRKFHQPAHTVTAKVCFDIRYRCRIQLADQINFHSGHHIFAIGIFMNF